MPDPLGLPHRDVTLRDSGRAPTARGDTLHGLTAIRDHGSEGHHLEPAMKDAVPQFCPHPTLTTQPPHRDVTLCDSGRAPTARGDTLHGLTTIRDPGSKGHLEPAMKDAVLESGTHPTLATQLSQYGITLRDPVFDIALRDIRRARAKRGGASPGLATTRGHGSKIDLESAVKLVTTIPRTWRRTPQPADSRSWTPHPLWTRRALPPSPSIDIIAA